MEYFLTKKGAYGVQLERDRTRKQENGMMIFARLIHPGID